MVRVTENSLPACVSVPMAVASIVSGLGLSWEKIGELPELSRHISRKLPVTILRFPGIVFLICNIYYPPLLDMFSREPSRTAFAFPQQMRLWNLDSSKRWSEQPQFIVQNCGCFVFVTSGSRSTPWRGSVSPSARYNCTVAFFHAN